MKTENTTYIVFYMDGNATDEFEYDALIPNLHVGEKIECDDECKGTISKIETNITKEDGILYIFQYIEVNI